MDERDPDDAVSQGARHIEILRAAQRRLDPIDSPRALGIKRFALQMQKRRHAVVERHVGLLRTDGLDDRCLLVSADGTVAFAIGRTLSGLFVEKRCCPITGPRTAQAMIFECESIFDRWCDAEPTRFDDPLLCDRLRRRGHELFTARS